jgi:hypothetical protein
LARDFSYNCIVENGHAIVLKPSPRVGVHEMDKVYSPHHLLEIPVCLFPLHLAIASQVSFLPLLIPKTSKQTLEMQQLVVHPHTNL